MISQRAREKRIVEKLRAGMLNPATPTDIQHPRPAGDERCHGCDETEADSLVGETPWHSLCVIFWQGRSEYVRERASVASPSRGVTPERPRWTIVTRADRPDVFAAFRRSFVGSVWVQVVADRRHGQRRRSGDGPPGSERRGVGRRIADKLPAQPSEFRLAHRGDGFDVYEALGPVAGRCSECDANVRVEIPRFTEPPARLELTVVHEKVPPNRTRHVVELQSFSATGRAVLASRIVV